MRRRDIGQQRAAGIAEVIDREDGDVEKVAAEQVAEHHVERAEAQRCQDHRRIAAVAQRDGQQRDGQQRGDEQDVDQRALELARKAEPQRARRRLGQRIGAELLAPRLRLVRAQPGGAALQRLQRILGAAGVPLARAGLGDGFGVCARHDEVAITTSDAPRSLDRHHAAASAARPVDPAASRPSRAGAAAPARWGAPITARPGPARAGRRTWRSSSPSCPARRSR